MTFVFFAQSAGRDETLDVVREDICPDCGRHGSFTSIGNSEVMCVGCRSVFYMSPVSIERMNRGIGMDDVEGF